MISFPFSKHHIKSDVYQMHILYCHWRITLCPVCDEPVPKDQLEEHHEDNHTETSCDMCGRKILKDKLEDHQVHAIVHVHVICM